MNEVYDSKRRALYVAVAALCTEVGYTDAEKPALESLVEMMQSFVTEAGRSAHQFTEVSSRARGNFTDVRMALIEMGTDLSKLKAHSQRARRMQVNKQGSVHVPPSPAGLQVGKKKSLPDHVPQHFLPFPDPHTFVKTPAYKKPQSDYKVLREKSAMYKRHIEQGLSRFATRTKQSVPLTSTGSLSSFTMLPEVSLQPYKSVLMSEREKGPMPVLDECGDDTDGREQMDTQDADRGNEHMAAEWNISLDDDDSSGQRDYVTNPYLQLPKRSRTQ
ncbi:transcription initiation factor TFIID subunit 8-like isoform X2 [Corticium candelabrum]|uniref:transcription initiation factor TFIID subunit 8-like isoform X2 n=1 Tax=Corticium candelabrum TaxID=121492 RepID=UPI002E25708A|nr:transcription initiation factor TFIID subunit 8-like isoform X2 [Corticium candelabrum]